MATTDTGQKGELSVPWSIQGSVYAVAYFGHGTAQMMAVLVPLFAAGLDVSPLFIGIALGSRHFSSLFLSIPSGAWMDRLGTRQVMIFFALIGMAVPPLYPATSWIPALAVLQMVLGFITGLHWQGAQTLVGQLMRGSPKYSARFTIANSIGALTTPVVIGVAWDHLGAWGAFLILSLFEFILLLACLTLPKGGTEATSGASPARMTGKNLVPKISDYRDAFRLLVVPTVMFTVLVSLLDHCSLGVYQSFYVVYLKQIGLSGTAIGALASSASLASILGSMCTDPVAQRVNHYWLLLIGITLSMIAVAVTPLLGLYILLLAATVMRGFLSGLVYPMVFAIMSRSVGPDQQGTSVGLRATGNRLVGSFIPILMGAVAEGVGIENSFLVIGAFLMVCMCAVGIYIYRTPSFRN